MTFLYKLTEGACPKSYGPNVARLAGLPACLVSRALELSARLEASTADKATPLAAAMADIRGVAASPAHMGLEELNALRRVWKELQALGGCEDAGQGAGALKELHAGLHAP